MNVAAAVEISKRLVPSLKYLHAVLKAKSEGSKRLFGYILTATEFKSIIKIGRTHMQDATPMTLGQEFSGYAAQVEYGIERATDATKRLFFLPQGGTAVGTVPVQLVCLISRD